MLSFRQQLINKINNDKAFGRNRLEMANNSKWTPFCNGCMDDIQIYTQIYVNSNIAYMNLLYKHSALFINNSLIIEQNWKNRLVF